MIRNAGILCIAIAILFGVDRVSAATFTVTKIADTNDGTCNADCSLREAILAANAVDTDDVIDFEPTFGWQYDRRHPRSGTIRQYRDLTLWRPAEPRFDEQREIEWLRQQGIDENQEESDAPWDDAEENGEPENPPEY